MKKANKLKRSASDYLNARLKSLADDCEHRVLKTMKLLHDKEDHVRAARAYWDAIELAGDKPTVQDCERVRKLCEGARAGA